MRHKMRMLQPINRRQFTRTLLTTAGAVGVAPAFLRGQNLNNKLNIAVIGVGGRGGGNLESVASENIVALCDVNAKNLDKASAKYPQARKHADFRKVFDHAKEFDAVVVSTCEHTHAFATMPALQLGKHVYCEKPLTHNIWEARRIREAAAKAKVATQMGIQIHATENYRQVVELVQSGIIGPVTRGACVGVARVGLAERSGRQAAQGHRLVLRAPDRSRSPCPRDWIGICGSARRRSGRSTRSISRDRNGIAGGISATAR